jgi:hypothetical protein
MTTGKLAGPPVRRSYPFDVLRAITVPGVVKLRLGHSKSGSVLVPEQIFHETENGWKFYQSSFFGPPIFGFNVEPKLHIVRFNVDVGPPRAKDATRIIVTVTSDGLIRRLSDGSHLYRCQVEGPPSFRDEPTGGAELLPDDDFALHLFHVTNAKAADAIRSGGEIWSSAWNLQGTRRLKNVAYTYFTSLPEIRGTEDLQRIAMASDGKIGFQTTSQREREQVLILEVYRESTSQRTESVPVAVPSALAAPAHLLLHRTGTEAYYEVVGPEIYRVGVHPGLSVGYAGGKALADDASLKRFTYIVLGDAADVQGLAAPYDEEETEQIMHLEVLEDCDPFAFWIQHANTDQMTGRKFESKEFNDRSGEG